MDQKRKYFLEPTLSTFVTHDDVDAEEQFLCRPQRFTEEHLKTYEHLSGRASQQSIPAAIADPTWQQPKDAREQ